MKMKILLTVSFLLNVTLAVVWIVQKKPPAPEILVEAKAEQAAASAPVSAEEPTQIEATAGTNTTPTTFDWRKVESDDYRQYINNLRAAGCPQKTIRDIIVADVNELFKARSRENSTNRFEYWRPGNPLANLFDEDALAKQQELTKEKREMLKTLLGDSAPTDFDMSAMMNPLEQMLDFLPSDKMTPLMELEQKYGAKLMNAMKDATQGDQTAMREALAEKDAAMLELLTPEQKFEYDLRLSQSSAFMRMQLGDFAPSEEEFREMFKLRKAVDDEFGLAGMGMIGQGNKEEKARYEVAQKELDAQIKTILGDRYPTYKHEQEWMGNPLSFVAKEFNVPKQTAFDVFDIKSASEQQAAQVRSNAALSPEQRTAALTAIRTETETAVTRVLGQEAAKAYVDRGGWINQLNK